MAVRKVLAHQERSDRTRACFVRAREHEQSGDTEARDGCVDEVVELNLQVAAALARRYRGRGVPVEDLEQVAALALVRAARRFDLDQERDFLSYAVPSMTGEIKRYFRDLGWTIRPPRRIQEVQTRALAARDRRPDLGRTRTAEEIAEELGVPAAEVSEALGADQCFQPLSLDSYLDDDQTPSGPFVTSDASEIEAVDAKLLLAPGLRALAAADRTLLRLRFVDGLTQSQIARRLGTSQMTVSRRLSGVLERLRRILGPPGPRGQGRAA